MARTQEQQHLVTLMIDEKDLKMHECFQICKSLVTDEYKSVRDQLKDMIKLGKLAEEAELIWRATEVIR